MDAVVLPVRTAVSWRDIPASCTCTWTWRTQAKPWRWDLTGAHAACPVHRPEGRKP